MKKIAPTLTYGLVHGSMWSFYGILLSFSSNFLYAYGFTDGQISLFLGLVTAASCGLQLLLGELVQRIPKLTVFGVLLAMGGSMICAGLAMGTELPLLPVAGLALGCCLLQAIPAMGNAFGMDAIARGSNTNFGIARGCGSIAFSLIALLTGYLVSSMGVTAMAMLTCANGTVFLLAVVLYHLTGEKGLAPQAKGKEAKKTDNFLKKNPLYCLFLLGCIFLQISHNTACNFLLQILSVKGGGAAEQGIATFVSAIMELPVMFGFGLLLKLMKCEHWLRLSAVFYVVKCLGLYLAQDPTGVYIAQATQLLGFAVYGIGTVHYTAKVVAADDTIRAQSYLASATAIGGLVSSSTAGFICQLWGAQSMLLVFALCAAIGALILWFSIHLFSRTPKGFLE